MVDIVIALIWAGVSVYGLWRFARAVERFAPLASGITPDDVAIPDDIIAWVAKNDDAWAQDDEMRAVREKYAEHRDWDKVRVALGLAQVGRK